MILSLSIPIHLLAANNAAGNKNINSTNNSTHIMDGSFDESSSTMSGANYIDADGLNVPINGNTGTVNNNR